MPLCRQVFCPLCYYLGGNIPSPHMYTKHLNQSAIIFFVKSSDRLEVKEPLTHTKKVKRGGGSIIYFQKGKIDRREKGQTESCSWSTNRTGAFLWWDEESHSLAPPSKSIFHSLLQLQCPHPLFSSFFIFPNNFIGFMEYICTPTACIDLRCFFCLRLCFRASAESKSLLF